MDISILKSAYMKAPRKELNIAIKNVLIEARSLIQAGGRSNLF